MVAWLQAMRAKKGWASMYRISRFGLSRNGISTPVGCTRVPYLGMVVYADVVPRLKKFGLDLRVILMINPGRKFAGRV